MGENADWLLQGEGKLCCLSVGILYIALGKQKFMMRREEFLQEAKKECKKVCWQHNYQFNETIFDYYIDWYLRMHEGDLDYYIHGQRLWQREEVMTAVEKNVLDAIINKFELN